MLEEAFSRRSALRLFAAGSLRALAGFFGGSTAEAANGLRSLLDAYPIRGAVRAQKTYRVDATVLLLSVPLLNRNAVGLGCVSLETGRHGDQSLVALQFAAGSDPGRARGLNRFGVIREAAVLRGANLTRSACAGFMTSSPEKSFTAAKESLHASGEETPCSMVVSDSAEKRTLSWKVKFALPGVTRWQDSSEILSRAEQSHLSGETPAAHPHGLLATFLYAVHVAIQHPHAAPVSFFYNGEPHKLEMERHGDRHQGTIFGENGAKKSTFTLWFDANDDSGLPCRIDFRARSFLRLTLEALRQDVPGPSPSAQPAPSLAWLLREESA